MTRYAALFGMSLLPLACEPTPVVPPTIEVVEERVATTTPPAPIAPIAQCEVGIMVLGTAQDAGRPQIGNSDDPAWDEPSRRRLPTSIAVVDQRGGASARYLFDATPHITEQVADLDHMYPDERAIGIDGIFLTHAHIGHYAGLMFLGHEAAGANGVPVYAMPRMMTFLTTNAPWSQLVSYENISLVPINQHDTIDLNGITVRALEVPHRDEFSEVVGYLIDGPERSAFYLPDIDSWDEWDRWGQRIEDVIADVDIAYLDATFFANGEIPGRDMTGFPHPFIAHSMERFASLPETERAKVHFIHMNHTNPALDVASDAAQTIDEAGYHVARRGDQFCL